MIKYPISIGTNGTTDTLQITSDQIAQRMKTFLATAKGSQDFNKEFGSTIDQARGLSSKEEADFIVITNVKDAINSIGNLTINKNSTNPDLGIKTSKDQNEVYTVEIKAQVSNTLQTTIILQ